MRVLLPTGTIMEVAKVVAVCEQRLFFNGRDMRLCERASEAVFANAIAFFHDAHGSFDVAAGGAVLLGNLSNSFISVILASLVQEGYIDLSDLKLQKKQPLTSHYKFDNGVSDAYLLSGFEVNMSCAETMGYPSMSGGCPVWSEDDDTEEDDTEDEDAGEEDCNE